MNSFWRKTELAILRHFHRRRSMRLGKEYANFMIYLSVVGMYLAFAKYSRAHMNPFLSHFKDSS